MHELQMVLDLIVQTVEDCTSYELSLLELNENNIVDHFITPLFKVLTHGINHELQVISIATLRMIGALTPVLKKYPDQAALCSQR